MHQTQELAKEIINKLVRAGFKAYFAGGWVRDYIMEHPSDDIDIATDAPPSVILDLFSHTIPVGLAFGVVIVVYKGHQFEVSTFRQDIEYLNGRSPEKIELATPQEDAQRRDFTINGLFYDPIEDEIHDYVGGMSDIKKGVVRTIGDPFERFFEDRLRMIRAVRFSARFNFPIEPETEEAIIENANTLFPAVAMERIWNEFQKMANYPRFDRAIIDMHRLKLLQEIFPSLEKMHAHDLQHVVSVFKDFPKSTPTVVYLMELFKNITLDELINIFYRLKLSGLEMKLMEFLYRGKKFIENPIKNDVESVYFYANIHSNLCLDVFKAHLPVAEREVFIREYSQEKMRLNKHIERVINKKPLINASHLMKEGIKPGVIMGQLLKEAEQLCIMSNNNDESEILTLLKKSNNWKI